jgi:nitroimidazol reductase NimA-like FMN-containing flavoprotein (pyridoxamine 5'-phosphate oxidase superfamily)
MDATWNTIDVLSPTTCVSLLRRHSFGRVGLSVDALPVILPVNYAYNGDRILLRSSFGTKLSAALRNAVVCFEIDGIEPDRATGWSVLVTGVSSELVGEDAVRAALVPLHPWSPSAGEHLVAIRVDVVTGRHVGPALSPV